MSNTNNIQDYESMSIKNLRALLTLRGYDCSQALEKSELIQAAKKLDATNYDDEAHKLFRELNLLPSAQKSRYSNLDAIWKHPSENGGTVYVGNYRAASDPISLKERNIVAIMNCQDATSQNYFENDPNFNIDYYRFEVARLSVSNFRNNLNGTNNGDTPLLDLGFSPAFEFIQAHIQAGKSVLIHCLAGAHRAGTVGVAWLMYQTGKTVIDSIALAKACRPIINPFATLLELLHRLERELKLQQQPQDADT